MEHKNYLRLFHNKQYMGAVWCQPVSQQSVEIGDADMSLKHPKKARIVKE